MNTKVVLHSRWPRLIVNLVLVGLMLALFIGCNSASSKDPLHPSLTQKPPTPTVRHIVETATVNPNNSVKTVFIIIMENHDWSDIQNNPSAAYINKTLLPQASYAREYSNPTGNHPSLPNYLWLEAGTNFGIKKDGAPSDYHQSTPDHLVNLLENAGIPWKTYMEGINGTDCPLSDIGLFTPRHAPMLYFDDVTDANNPSSGYCIQHIRPFSELRTDLSQNTVARFNLIVPDLCNDMHNNKGCETADSVKNGDTWLSEQVPLILDSQAYKDGGALFITWDESEEGDNPIGMILLSSDAKGGGYSNTIHYTHSSMLRTIQEIFGVEPFLGASATSNDLSDLFKVFP